MNERRFPFLNRVVIGGTVARKPALRTNKSGVATLKLSLTVSMPTLSDDMTRKQVSTIRVSVFIVGQLAVSCERLLASGSEIIVEGRLSSPPAHGSVSRLEVHAERIQFVDADGVLQFLVRDFIEQDTGSNPEKTAPPEQEQVAVTEKPGPVTQRRSAAKRTSSSKRQTTVTAAHEKDSPSKPKRGTAKRPPDSAESTPTAKPRPRRHRSAEKRPASGESTVTKPTGKSPTAKPAPSRKRPSEPGKPVRRPRQPVKKVESVGKTKDKKISASKPGSGSPFELVETEDTFDPFLLEE